MVLQACTALTPGLLTSGGASVLGAAMSCTRWQFGACDSIVHVPAARGAALRMSSSAGVETCWQSLTQSLASSFIVAGRMVGGVVVGGRSSDDDVDGDDDDDDGDGDDDNDGDDVCI